LWRNQITAETKANHKSADVQEPDTTSAEVQGPVTTSAKLRLKLVPSSITYRIRFHSQFKSQQDEKDIEQAKHGQVKYVNRKANKADEVK
jgi:hypothetical protein